MNRFSPIFFSLFLACAPAVRGAVPDPAPYFGGGPLTRSVRNEANAAIDNGAGWLAARQGEDGSWGDGDVLLTAICAISLLSTWDTRQSARPSTFPSCARAIGWLRSPAATNALASVTGDKALAARAWREMALCAFTGGKEPADPVLRLPLPVTNAPLDRALFVEWPMTEARRFRSIPTRRPGSTNASAIVRSLSDLQRGDPIDPQEKTRLADDLARGWADPAAGAPWAERAETAWWLARVVNRALNGELRLPAGEGRPSAPLDWRRELAEKWIGNQLIDTTGHGYWGERSPETTAFALLLLGEL